MKFKFSNIEQLVSQALELRYFKEEKGTIAIPCTWTPGKGKFCLIVGENASGKSFIRRVLHSICSHATEKTEYIHLSMEGRKTMGAASAFIYGDESWEATGEISGQTVLMGIKTSKARENRHIVFWDEPDLGLSDSWAKAMGREFAKFANNPPEHLIGAFVVTHNKNLVKQLIKSEPHFLYVGSTNGPKSIPEWIKMPLAKRNLEELKKVSVERFRLIGKILKDK